MGFSLGKIFSVFSSHTSSAEEAPKKTPVQQNFHQSAPASTPLGRSPERQRQYFHNMLARQNKVAPGTHNQGKHAIHGDPAAVASGMEQSGRAPGFLKRFKELCEKENPSGNLKLRPRAEKNATQTLATEHSMHPTLTTGVLRILRENERLRDSGLRTDVKIIFNETPAQGPAGELARNLSEPQIKTLRDLYDKHLTAEGYSDLAMKEAMAEFRQTNDVSLKTIKQQLKKISTENGAVPTKSPDAEQKTPQETYTPEAQSGKGVADFFGSTPMMSYREFNERAAKEKETSNTTVHSESSERRIESTGNPASRPGTPASELSSEQTKELRELYEKHLGNINEIDDEDIANAKSSAKNEFREKHSDVSPRTLNRALADIINNKTPVQNNEPTEQARPQSFTPLSARQQIAAAQNPDDPFAPLAADRMEDLRKMYAKAMFAYGDDPVRARMEVEVESADKYPDVRLYTLDDALDKLQNKPPRPAPSVRFASLEELTRPLSTDQMDDLSKMYRKAMFAYGDDPVRAKMEAEVQFSDKYPNVSLITLDNAIKEVQKNVG